MLADVNRHEGDDSAQVAAAVFNDGEPVNLVGGDLFEARTATERVLLKAGWACYRELCRIIAGR